MPREPLTSICNVKLRKRSRLLPQHLAHAGGETCSIQTIVGKKLGRVAGLAEGRHAQARHRHGVLLAEQLGHGGAHAAIDAVLLDRQHASGLCCGGDDRLLVERLHAHYVHNLSRDTLSGQRVSRRKRLRDLHAARHNGDVRTLAQHVCKSDVAGEALVIDLGQSRFYDPQQGRVLFDGVPMKDIEPESLMSRISMVFQDVYLFQDTIRDNIRFGKPGATDEEIIAAAEKACCHDFIMRLPQGYDTMVGEGGCTLSGGEKQRISIARAILKDAPIILLDEATASLDPENEVEVQKAIDTLIKGRTVIVIAHKLKTIMNADRIVVLEDGRVKEQGTHDELMRHEGLYARLWTIQEKSAGWTV